jgi:VWFA-related protein
MRSQLSLIIGAGSLFFENTRVSDESFVLRFVSQDKITILQDWTNNRTLLKNAVENSFSEGGQSALLDAIFRAASKIDEKPKDETKRKIIVLISDCEDRDSKYKQKEVLDYLKLKNIQFFAIGLLNDLPSESGFVKSSPKEKAKEMANLFAHKTNGIAFFPKYSMTDHKEIIDAIKKILFETQAQYEIGYFSNRKNSNPKIRIEVANDAKGEKRQVFVRDKVLIPKE